MKNICFVLFLILISLTVLAQNTAEELIESAIDLSATGDNINAIKQLDKAVLLNPKAFSAYTIRGDIKAEMGDYNSAIADYNKAIQVDPTDSEPYKNRAGVKIKLKDYVGAVNDYTLAIERNVNDAEAYFLRGRAMADAGNIEGAMRDYGNSLQLNSKYADVFAYIADIKIRQNKFFEAISDCNKAVILAPDLSIGYYFRGIAKISLTDKMGGCLDLSKAGELGYRDAYITIKKSCN